MSLSFDDKIMVPFPHCDSLVLHKPKECYYCDMYPELQEKRVLDGVNFTGGNDPGKSTCPSEVRRPLAMINRWYGNVPRKEPIE